MSVFNLRRMSTSTTGTGTITLGSAVTGFKAFSDSPAIPDQTVVTYAIADTNASEIGYGLYTVSGSTLTRNVIESTNSNNPLSLTSSAQVFITSAAGDLQSDTAFPNRIRNGGMDIWQRGTATQTVTTSGAASAKVSTYNGSAWSNNVSSNATGSATDRGIWVQANSIVALNFDWTASAEL